MEHAGIRKILTCSSLRREDCDPRPIAPVRSLQIVYRVHAMESLRVVVMPTSSASGGDPSELGASLRASLRAALWTHRDSLDRLRDAICAFSVDLRDKGMPTAEIAATVRAVVSELRDSGEQLAAQLADADPSLDQTVTWCLEFGSGPQSESQQGDRGRVGRNSAGADSGAADRPT
jgi:hypothetical protein